MQQATITGSNLSYLSEKNFQCLGFCMSKVSFILHFNTLKSISLTSYEPGLSAFLVGVVFGFSSVSMNVLINLHFIEVPSSNDNFCYLDLCDNFSRKIIIITLTFFTLLYVNTVLCKCYAHEVSPKPLII